MAAFTHGIADSAAIDQRNYDLTGIVRADARAKKPCDGFELGSFSRCPGIGAALRRERFLPGVPVHAGPKCRKAIF
jgi:hypothetical protein